MCDAKQKIYSPELNIANNLLSFYFPTLFNQVERRDDKKNALELRLKFWEYNTRDQW